MKKAILILLIVVSYSAFSQTDQQEIDKKVWKPFAHAITTQNTEAFIALHSKELIRAEINRNKVMGWEEYKKNMETNWPEWKKSNEKNKVRYTFELRFTERISNGEMAYEVGYFKNEMIDSSNVKKNSYGKFHVVLRKEQGVWKILVDSDSNEGNTITEEIFQAAKPVSGN